ncbi:MAG TPA: rod-binding protein, partial [Symbiobacteriaceae bacterium]|nr:rod-binding protein [Symbiobacteriaceae bacterium]
VSGASRPAQTDPRDQKLRETAREFEALFVEMVFKRMRAANNALGTEPKSFARSTYEEWQDQEMARSISTQGSFGLAEILYRQLQQQAAATGKA